MRITPACRYSLLLFFTLALFLGLAIFKDFGVHTDEYRNQTFGNLNLRFISEVFQTHSMTKPKPIYLHNHSSIHGPVIETFLAFITSLLKPDGTMNVIYFRHLSCYLIFLIGIFFFFKLCFHLFKNWILALTGCLFLFLSPLIFAHSFYNTVDIPFLSFYIICMYTFVLWVENKKFKYAALHALACALLIGIRPMGLIIPLLSFVFIAFNLIKKPSLELFKTYLLQFVFYSFLLLILIIIAWPIFWPNPYEEILKTFKINYELKILLKNPYLGKIIPLKDTPWHYSCVWILISTPLIYSFFFFGGIYVMIRSIFIRNKQFFNLNILFIISCFLLPLILSQAKIYNSWRHIFFVYPAFLIIALSGLLFIWQGIKERLSGVYRSLAHGFILLMIILSLLDITFFIIKHHPFEYLYFNRLAGKNLYEIKGNFDLDYWRVSHKQAIELLLKNVSDDAILLSQSVYTNNNLNIFPDKDKKRIKLVPLKYARYLITDDIKDAKGRSATLLNSIYMDSMPIVSIYKLN